MSAIKSGWEGSKFGQNLTTDRCKKLPTRDRGCQTSFMDDCTIRVLKSELLKEKGQGRAQQAGQIDTGKEQKKFCQQRAKKLNDMMFVEDESTVPEVSTAL